MASIANDNSLHSIGAPSSIESRHNGTLHNNHPHQLLFRISGKNTASPLGENVQYPERTLSLIQELTKTTSKSEVPVLSG